MIAKAERRGGGLRRSILARIGDVLFARRRARQAAEDAEDLELVREARAEGGETIPLAEIARRYKL